jgi:hypothetical protein
MRERKTGIYLTTSLPQVSITNFISPHPMYVCLLPLRCLMLKENNPEKWSKLLELQSHHDDVKNNDQALAGVESVGKFIPR